VRAAQGTSLRPLERQVVLNIDWNIFSVDDEVEGFHRESSVVGHRLFSYGVGYHLAIYYGTGSITLARPETMI